MSLDSIDEEGENVDLEDDTDPLDNLAELGEGCLFADRYGRDAEREGTTHVIDCRYRIEARRVQDCPHCRLAVDISQEEDTPVFLKFFPLSRERFENSIRMHDLMASSPHVCKCGCTMQSRWRGCVSVLLGCFKSSTAQITPLVLSWKGETIPLPRGWLEILHV